MLSRVAAVKAPCTHNRRRVTGSSGRRRKGSESERQRSSMSRHVFNSAVLLLLFVMMCCSSGAATADEKKSTAPTFEWKKINCDGSVTVNSLGAPGLLKVNGDVFAVAEAQCKKGEGDENTFIGIASQLLTKKTTTEPEEVLKETKDKTQVLEKDASQGENKVDVSRPTTVVKGSEIYMLVGKCSGKAAGGSGEGGAEASGLFLVKGEVSGDESDKNILWKDTKDVPRTFFGEEIQSLEGLIGGGGSGVGTEGNTLFFPVEATKKEDGKKKTVSLLIYSSDAESWKLSKGVPADGCSDPSVVEWEKDKLMMMTACDDGRRRVYESGDKGDSWTEALGTLSRVWMNPKELEKGFRSGFTTAKIDNRDVMLVTLPVYSENVEKGNGKGVLRLWLTDNTHITDIGPVSDDDDVAASSLLYKSAEGEDNKEEKEELIALYEKKKGGEDEKSRSLWSVRPTAQLERVKEVLATWKKVDERVSQLCPNLSAVRDNSPGTACSPTVKITDGLVGFLSGNFSEDTWRDEYLGVDATVNNKGRAAKADNGVKFTGSWAEWPVGKQGDNQLYHFANYNFTLVATVSIHKAPEGDTPISLMGVRMNGEPKKSFGLSYEKGKWKLLCSEGPKSGEHSRDWEPGTTYQVAIVLQNGTHGSAYVDGQPVGNAQCAVETADAKGISHFYIGGDGGDAGDEGSKDVTVTNVLLYNRPLTATEVAALNKKKPSILRLDGENELVEVAHSPEKGLPAPRGTVSQPILGDLQPKAPEPLRASKDAVGAGASTTAVSTVKTFPAGEGSAKQLSSVTSSEETQTVDGASLSDGGQTVDTGDGGGTREDEPHKTPEARTGSGENGEGPGETSRQEEGAQPQVREVNATALSSNLGTLSQGNNSDAGIVRGSGLLPSLLLLLGQWEFAAL
ncbi:putative trans-sialidase, Group V [Trypanosoma cruzi]|uniref:Putative trans-sialidase, Group V n=1 Tax=Trypanosoma cruzi TaxID=5693 RepID=A0A2V2VSL0_TRYCR|nr:putative trans-sialidase, Group V [Trypanosoma cruzi]